MISKAKPIAPGSRIGVIAPASAPIDPTALKKGMRRIEALGFTPVLDRLVIVADGYLAGSDERRADELNRMIQRDDVDALFCVRGGYGCTRMLPLIDFDAATRNPKLLVGYSDITALHFALLKQSNWVGIQGPMVAVEWPEEDVASESLFWNLASHGWTGKLVGPANEQLSGLRTGFSEGMLIGGNLAVITALIGSPYMPDLEGAILYIEDVCEPPYRIDGYFSQLRNAGILESLGGLVVGGFTRWKADDDKPTLSYDEVVNHYASFVDGPVATGLTFGHFHPKNAMPVGTQGKLSVSDRDAVLTLTEAVTSVNA